MLKYFFFLSFALFIFSQSFFDVYKSDLPKSVLEGKHKIGNIEELVNEYAEISPILVYVYIENLEKINSKQKTEFNLTQLKDILLSIRKEWVKSILKDKSLSNKTQIALTDLYSTYSFSEIHQAVINLDQFKNNPKFNYILAKHMAHEDFGVFNSAVNYEQIVNLELTKLLERLDTSFNELKEHNGQNSIVITSLLYLLKRAPIQLTEKTSIFTFAEYLERVEQAILDDTDRAFKIYKKDKMKKSAVRLLFGANTTNGVKPDFVDSKISTDVPLLQFQYDYKFFLDESRFLISYIGFFIGVNFDAGSDSKSNSKMNKIAFEGKRVSVPPEGTNRSEYITERTFIKKNNVELVNFLSFDYGLSIPLKISSFGWREKPEFFTLEANAGLRYTSYSYNSSSDFESKDYYEVTNVIYQKRFYYGEIKRSYTKRETIKKSELSFVYGFSAHMRPFKTFAISYYYFAESSAFGLSYGF